MSLPAAWIAFGAIVLAVASFPVSAQGLRDYEGRIRMGTVVSYYDFRLRWDDGKFLETMKREYGLVTAPDFAWSAPWDEMPLRPARHVYDFTVNDEVVKYIEDAGLEPRGHPLVWADWPPNSNRTLPAWLTQGNWTRDQVIAILREHVSTVVGRYRGRIKSWAVVNEPVASDGTLLDNFWLRRIGPEYIEIAFRAAHEADPDAYLYLNDDGSEGMNRNSDGVYALVAGLLAKGVPIHGVGLETHVDLDYVALGGGLADPPDQVRQNMERYGRLGLRVEITEMDVRLPTPPSARDLANQARIYAEMLDACLSVPACSGFTTWGFTDRYSWIPRSFPGLGAALPFDESFVPKPAYSALLDRLKLEPRKVVEFYHSAMDHYFVTLDPDEIAALDGGAFAGWQRTGLSFSAYAQPHTGYLPICRFYLPPGSGDSHFYSASPAECALVQQQYPAFQLERLDAMYLGGANPVTGVCRQADIPLYRVWNARGSDTNHRYTSDRVVRDAMVAKGYVAEGSGPDAVTFCAPR